LKWTSCVIGITLLLAVVQVMDAAVDLYAWVPTNLVRSLKPSSLPDGALVSELKIVAGDLEDRKRSVFIYDGSLSQLGPYVLPAQLGLQIIGDQAILEEYAKWESSAKGALQRRFCLIKKFDKAINDQLVEGNLIYALSSTLLQSYSTIYVIVSPEIEVSLPKQFEIRTGPDFSIYAIPWASVVKQTKHLPTSAIPEC
jgi:hypothetical protein